MRLQKNLGSNLDLPLSGCVTLSKTFSFSKPWISDPKIKDNSICPNFESWENETYNACESFVAYPGLTYQSESTVPLRDVVSGTQ